MFIWSLVLMGLGILAILDSQFNYGYIFRTADSLMFFLVSLGVLVRTQQLAKIGFKERLLESNEDLKARMAAWKQSLAPIENKESKQPAGV